jgi:cephalosporin-C deacetylase-like acetyl esterase
MSESPLTASTGGGSGWNIPKMPTLFAKALAAFLALNVADAITVPVLINVGLKDRTCPPGGIKRVFKAIKSRDKKLVEYPQADHNDDSARRWAAMVDFLAARLNAR